MTREQVDTHNNLARNKESVSKYKRVAGIASRLSMVQFGAGLD